MGGPVYDTLYWLYVFNYQEKDSMASVQGPSEPKPTPEVLVSPTRRSTPWMLKLPTNVYLLLFFTMGKGFQITIATLSINYYAHSLGYRPDFIGLLSAMPAIGSLLSSVPSGMLADRIGRKPVLLGTAILTPLFLALVGLTTSAPLLLLFSFLQGVVASAYWVTNLPLLVESTTERQRVGVLALNSFILIGVGSLGNLLGGAVPEFVAGVMHVSASSTEPLRWGVLSAALVTLLFGLPLWFLKEPKHDIAAQKRETVAALESETRVQPAPKEKLPVGLFVKLLVPDLLFTMGEGAVVALIQLYFILRFLLSPGMLGIIFTVSGLAGGLFSLTAPLFVHRWGKLRIVTSVMYMSAPLMLLIGYAPTLQLAIAGEYARSFMRALIEPVYAAFVMERVTDRHRATLSGFYGVTWSIGFSIGPTIAGWLQTNVNLAAAFVFGASCLMVTPTLLLVFFGKRK
ncbi:MAG TPA: MFS transporter [Ktedonobacteraceae bacterium]